jgi:hypothetical protein
MPLRLVKFGRTISVSLNIGNNIKEADAKPEISGANAIAEVKQAS